MGVATLAMAGVICAAIQRAVGVGYSLVLLPAAIAVLPDAQAVSCVLTAGIVLSLGLLVSSGRRPRPDDVTLGVLAFGPLGQVVALAALGALRGPALRVAAACALLAGCASALAQGRLRLRAPGFRAGAIGGLSVGAVGALTGVIGPFVALLLTVRADAGGEDLRRRLWACTAWLSTTALIIATVLGTVSPRGALIGVALAPALALGALTGAPLARRVKPRQHRLAVLLLAAIGAGTLLAGA